MTVNGLGIYARQLTLTAITVLAMSATAWRVAAEDAAVTIDSAFPGGNVKVTEQTGSTVHVEPDLRGGRPWFYWYFEATSMKPGKVTFVFPEKVAGFKNGGIGYQGPAISKDRGKTWNWMGTEQVEGDSFYYEFAKANERVRFAVTIPYLQTDLDAFLKKNAKNPHLKTTVLAKSRNGRDVELLQIGTPGPNVTPMLVTGRHHAAETMASYLLEGFLQEAMSDSDLAKEFREKYVLFAVPFVDKDGVEAGDQGKNRRPHDHNRDYGEESIYPEIQAIKKLDKEKNFRFALDFHCPTLVMSDHQVMYFVGPKEHPANNFQNVSEFAKWIKKGLPKTAPVGPYVWLKPTKTPAPMNSNYFGFKEGTIMAATLEFPFAPSGRSMDPASCRKYGQVVLAAWVATHFRSADEGPKDVEQIGPGEPIPQELDGEEILLLVRSDDMGAAHAVNQACIDTVTNGIARSVEVIVPAPWFLEAAAMLKQHPQIDVGVHLDLTSEWSLVKWGPVSKDTPSLVDANGHFYPTTRQRQGNPAKTGFLESDWKLDEVERELRAQIELALKHLPNVTHLSAHMGTAVSTPELKSLVDRLASDYGLPIEVPKLKRVSVANSSRMTAQQKEAATIKMLEALKPGVWMLIEHPGLDTPEMRAIHHKGYEHVATDRAGVTKTLTSNRVIETIKRRRIKLISYADLLPAK